MHVWNAAKEGERCIFPAMPQALLQYCTLCCVPCCSKEPQPAGGRPLDRKGGRWVYRRALVALMSLLVSLPGCHPASGQLQLRCIAPAAEVMLRCTPTPTLPRLQPVQAAGGA